jgi:anti-sigma-K factor RskA
MTTGSTNKSSEPRSEENNPAMTALLRSMYAAPTDPAYWSGLEARVLTRLRENGPVAWWAGFSEWRSAGLVAAAVVLLIAGVTVVREQQKLANTRDMAAGAAAFTVFGTSDDAAIALTPPTGKNARLDAPERYIDLIKP